ncbi:MAG: hypothetical protein P9M07_02815 [Candidatus Aceula meridiana]|nr:hypothetical protein [Candidatus Aceula meridiana]
MLKKLVLTGLCIMFLATTTAAFAESVYVTENGSKYHKEDCRFIKNRESQEMKKADAVTAGYAPCSRCFKEDLSKSDSKKSQKAVSKKDSKKTENKS